MFSSHQYQQELQQLQNSFIGINLQGYSIQPNQPNQSIPPNRKPKKNKNRNTNHHVQESYQPSYQPAIQQTSVSHSGSHSGSHSVSHSGSHSVSHSGSHSGTVTLFNNHNKTFRICEFVTMLNNIKTSKNIIDICNSIDLTNPVLKSHASQYGLTYKSIFNGSDVSSNGINLLSIIKCNRQPVININIFKTIAYIKTYILYSKLNNKYNNQTSEWVGVLAGLILYFDELDMKNRKKTNNVSKICKELTSNDIE